MAEKKIKVVEAEISKHKRHIKLSLIALGVFFVVVITAISLMIAFPGIFFTPIISLISAYFHPLAAVPARGKEREACLKRKTRAKSYPFPPEMGK